MINTIETGRKIRELIKHSRYSVTDVSDILNISKTAMYCWFRGESLPSIDNLCLLAELLEIRVDDMISYSKILNISKAA